MIRSIPTWEPVRRIAVGSIGDAKSMFFLMRVAFWLSLVILLIPADPNEAAKSGRTVSTFEAVGAAQAAYEDARGFCGRNPGACDIGQMALDTFSAKARTAAHWVYRTLEGKEDGPVTTASTPKPAPAAAPVRKAGEAPTQPRRPVS